ncbi:putative ankyrin repeat containing protein [Halotydeus destructor]|nr:putative ankyrin repeat containing protein [Halotydeus destructor]
MGNLKSKFMRRGCDSANKFFKASILNNSEKLMSLVEKGHDINEPDATGMTGLHFAASQGLCSSVEMLIQAGARSTCNAQRCHPLHLAIKFNHVDTVQLLLRHFEDTVNAMDAFGKTPLESALKSNQPAIVDLLLRHGARVGPHLYEKAFENGSVDCLKKMIQFKPYLLDLDILEDVQFSHKCCPCLQLLVSAGFPFDMTRFRHDQELSHVKVSYFPQVHDAGYHDEDFEDEDYMEFHDEDDDDDEDYLDFNHHYPHFHSRYSSDDLKSFKEFEDQNGGRLSQPRSLMNLAQWSIYAACRDKSVEDIVNSIECPKTVKSFLLLQYLDY